MSNPQGPPQPTQPQASQFAPAPQINVDLTMNLDAELAFMVDQSTLDPNRHYRFVQDRSANVAKKKIRGYRIESRSQSGIRTLVDLEQTADDTIRVADQILMSCPKEGFLRRRQQLAHLAEARLGSTTQRLKERVAQAQASGANVQVTEEYVDRGPKEQEEET